MIKQFIENIPNGSQKNKIIILYILRKIKNEADTKFLMKEMKTFKVFLDYINLNRYLRELENIGVISKTESISEKKSIKYLYKLTYFKK